MTFEESLSPVMIFPLLETVPALRFISPRAIILPLPVESFAISIALLESIVNVDGSKVKLSLTTPKYPKDLPVKP